MKHALRGSPDRNCTVCGLQVPSIAYYGHLMEEHQWSDAQLDDLLRHSGERGYKGIRTAGYRPFIVDSGGPSVVILVMFGLAFLVTYQNLQYGVVLLGGMVAWLVYLLRLQATDADEALARCEMLRERIMRLEERLEGRR